MSEKSIFIAGHRGLVGSALLRLYSQKPGWRIITRTRAELDLKNESAVRAFFAENRPQHVILAAARVGGIGANSRFQVEFMLENLRIQNNVIEAAHQFEVGKLLFLGSSCIYPKQTPQPIKEDSLLTGPLEATNEGYALAKIAGLKLCQYYRRQYGRNFISAMPTNLYGPNDNFDVEEAHVLPTLIHRFHDARLKGMASVPMWGTGIARREFLHTDDVAEACFMLMERYESDQPINIGVGKDISIRELAELVGEIVGYKGDLAWDSSKPDGTLLKRLDVSRIEALGWKARIGLREGITRTYEWYCQNEAARP
jgi:GDP-L-fucose synthase